jgi:hypothetical protein
MEHFKMPMRQVNQIYTRSELVIMGWRSAEQAYNMHISSGRRSNDSARGRETDGDWENMGDPGGDSGTVEQRLMVMGQALEPIAKKMVNERGEVDLRRLTGPEAMRYMAVLGVPIVGRLTE